MFLEDSFLFEASISSTDFKRLDIASSGVSPKHSILNSPRSFFVLTILARHGLLQPVPDALFSSEIPKNLLDNLVNSLNNSSSSIDIYPSQSAVR